MENTTSKEVQRALKVLDMLRKIDKESDRGLSEDIGIYKEFIYRAVHDGYSNRNGNTTFNDDQNAAGFFLWKMLNKIEQFLKEENIDDDQRS